MNELSQMFPTLDGELGSVANHFRFDNLVATAEENSENADLNEVKTPLQSTKQFPASSSEPADEEDDEPTISTDCFSSQIENMMATQPFSDGVVSIATKLLEEVINKSSPKPPPEPITETLKYKTKRSTNLQVKKQSTIHGSESTSSVGSLKQMSNLPLDSANRFPRRNIEYSRFMSVDQRSISDTEDNVAIESGSMKNTDSKAQSCVDIKLSCTAPRSPGAIVVKEKYIELPKQVAHMTTSSSKDLPDSMDYINSTSLTSSTESVSRLQKNERVKQRFTTIKVDESQLGPSVQF